MEVFNFLELGKERVIFLFSENCVASSMFQEGFLLFCQKQ